MNNSTENVTLITAFVQDIIKQYDGKPEFQVELEKMAEGYDLSDPMKHFPIELYNDMCDWIENQIGETSARILGRKIGNTAYENMLKAGLVNEKSKPLEIMEALKNIAETVISDPLKRGWEVIENGTKHIIMRRTQTFNSTLQFSLLDQVIRKSRVMAPSVSYQKSVFSRDEFDEYKVSWL